MNYSSLRCTIIQNIRFNNPHACTLIWRISNKRIPMNLCTRVLDTVHGNSKEKLGSSNTQAMHTQLQLVGVNKNTVVSGCTSSPGSNSMHVLTAHATTPTGCIEGGDGRGIDIDLVGEIEEWRRGGIQFKLTMKEGL